MGASDIADALAGTRSGWSVTRAEVMQRLVIERLNGRPLDGYVTWAMRQGVEREPLARRVYEFVTDLEVADASIYPHPKIAGAHASPDGLVGKDGLVQIKCPQPPAHLTLLEGGEIPIGYLMQVHWEMACTGRSWSDFVSWSPDFPAAMQLIVRRIDRDSEVIAELEDQVRAFLEEVDARFQALLTAYEPERVFNAAMTCSCSTMPSLTWASSRALPARSGGRYPRASVRLRGLACGLAAPAPLPARGRGRGARRQCRRRAPGAGGLHHDGGHLSRGSDRRWLASATALRQGCAMKHLPEIDDETPPPKPFLREPQTLVERIVSWLMLMAAILAFAVFYYYVLGDVPLCDEAVDQCEASVGPYQVR